MEDFLLSTANPLRFDSSQYKPGFALKTGFMISCIGFICDLVVGKGKVS
jgi:hypothetical protein